MLNKIKLKIKHLVIPIISEEKSIKKFIKNGRIPWSEGYENYKWREIEKVTNDTDIVNKFITSKELIGYGLGLDERIIEYPWIIANLSNTPCKLLDAGSTFNYKVILDNKIINQKEITILTYFPECQNFNERRISYLYTDLRDIPIRASYFDEIVCQSTLEHIDMNNSMYGYESEFNANTSEKSYDYILVVKELLRVLNKRGKILITVPYGRFENHGFFQQFDSEMISQIKESLKPYGFLNEIYYKYNKDGWGLSNKDECKDAQSYNPHTGIGKGNDNAAHSRAISCIKFIKA
jgi:hypothetical protein